MDHRNTFFDCSTIAPEELSRMIPQMSSEGEIADVYAQISNHFMLVEDNDCTSDSTSCVEARIAEDTWGDAMDAVEHKVKLLVSGKNASCLSSRLLTPFMAKNGYSAFTGRWVRTA